MSKKIKLTSEEINYLTGAAEIAYEANKAINPTPPPPPKPPAR